MDSCHNTNLPYTQTEFSSYALSKSIGARKSRWISPSPKKKTMTQTTAFKRNEVKNNETSNTKSLERNSLKRKSTFDISDIDRKIKRLEVLHEETTTSDSDTTITKIDRLSKKRKLSKPGEESSDSENLCKTLKSVNNTVNQITLLQPFSREEDIKIIMYFHKFMELLARKDDIYVYQLLQMKYHFQRSAKFLQDRFLNEILPNLYVYDCLTLEEMVVFYDRADMFVPEHVQHMIEEKVRSITGHGISSCESPVITISDSENGETDLIGNENVKSPCSSKSSSIILKRRNRVLQLSSSPSICSTSVSEKTAQTVQHSDSDWCINSEVLSVMSSVEEPNSVNIVTVETCQLVNDFDLSKHSFTSVNLCDENKCYTNVKDSKNDHSDNINIYDSAEGSSDCVSLSSCVFETNEKQVKCVRNYNNQVVSMTTNFTKTVQSSNCNPNEVTKSSQTIQDDQTNDNFILHTDHTYVKLTQMVDISLDNVNVQQIPDKTSSFSSETASMGKECTSIKIPDKICVAKTAEKSSREQEIQHKTVKSISKRGFADASTMTEAPVTKCEQTQLSSFDLHNIDSISRLEHDVIVLKIYDNSNIYVYKKGNVNKIAQHETLENSIQLTDNRNMEILKCYTNYKSNINTAIKIFTETNMKDNNSRYNLRKFVKNPRGGTCSRQNIRWFKSEETNVLDVLTNDCPKTGKKKRTILSRRTQQINTLFSFNKLKLRTSKFYNEIDNVLCSPASDRSDESISSVMSSPIFDTSTTTNSDNEICKKLSSGIVIRKTYVKKNNKSELNSQMSKASSVTEEFNQSVSTVTSTSFISNKPVSSGSDSDKPTITDINMLENNAINDYQKRICTISESDIQINTISPLITETANHSLSTVTSTSVSNKSLEDSSTENVSFGIKNDFEKCVYKKLESLYRICKPDSSPITEESATSTPASKKLVYIQINKNTGNILGLRPVRTSTDKKVISSSETSKALSVVDNINGKRISEAADLTSTVSDSDSAINIRSDSDETISSTDSRVNAYYDMDINIFEDLPCEYDPKCSSVQKNQNLVKKTNEMIVSTSRPVRKPALNECTDEYSVIKPIRTYTRKRARANPPESSSTVSVKTESDDSEVKRESLNSSADSGLEMIASQLLLGSPIASTSRTRASISSSASDDVILIEDSPNCILDFLVDDIKIEMDEEDTSMPPTNMPGPIYETVPVNKDDVNITTHSFSTISEADSVWFTIKRIMSLFESPIVMDDSEAACRRVVQKTKTPPTDSNITSTTCNEENDERIKQERIEMNEAIKQEWITDSDSWDNYPEMIFDCAKIKQEISILESNTIAAPYFDEENFDPVLPVQLPNENIQTHMNMSRKLKAVVTQNRLSINHLKPVTETEYTPEHIIKTEYSAETQLE